MLSQDVQQQKKTQKSHQVLRIPVGWCGGHHAFQSFQQPFPFSQNGTPLGLQMHSAALQGHYPWTSRNQGNQRAKKKNTQTENMAPPKEGV